MTAYFDRDRRAERGRLHRLVRRFNYWFFVLLLLAVLVPGTASAAPRCPGGDATPQGCSYQIDRDTACAWPLRLVKVGKVTMCIRLGVQP